MMTKRLMSLVFVVAATSSAILVAGPAPAAEDLYGGGPNAFGLEWSETWLTGEDFVCEEPALAMLRSGGTAWWTNNGPATETFRAHLVLPSGALIDGYFIVFNDTQVSTGISVLFRMAGFDVVANTQHDTLLENYSPAISETPGMHAYWYEVDPDRTYENRRESFPNRAYYYFFEVGLPGTGEGVISFRGIAVRWKRQISPAPAVATFADVPVGAFGFQHVEALAASGITGGCGGGNFCPNQPLTRVQMAVFLAKALGLHWAP